MFHTFETSQNGSPVYADVNASSAAKRRTSTVRACEPCRRRKIRCNGELPCETCQWYRKASSCHYTEPRQRQMPSKRSVEKISHTLQEYRGVLQKLFPNVHPEQLTGLSRDRLVDLISKSSPFQAPSPITPGTDERPPTIHPDAGSLEQLQPLPEEMNDNDDYVSRPKALRGITDEVNALSLSMKQSSSYLGISSVMAALRVILWLDPECQAFVNRSPERSNLVSREASSPPEATDLLQDTPNLQTMANPVWDEIPLINAYFEYVHPFVPLIDEESFRDTYMTRRRSDSRWQLLLNTVLAMGSMANGNSDDTSHSIYFLRLKEHLDLGTLGGAHIETVQALAVLSGFYLHYVQQPNLANAMMGATLRMSTMLGLHRDYSEGVGPVNTKKATFSIEMRRRIWWSAFCLDSWASSSLGRPSMGRMGHAITAKSPQEPIGGSHTIMTLAQENIRFCIISSRMEDSLAWSPIMDETEREALDQAFIEWFRSSSVQQTSPRASSGEMPGITVIKNVMRWRYLSSRVILHRPVLLWYAMRRMNADNLSDDRRAAIDACRDVTEELITDISSTWKAQKECMMSGWNATWLLYQAVMVPLLSLFSDPLDPGVVEKSRRQVEDAMIALLEMRYWSTTAKRSLEVVSRIYEASRRHSPEPPEEPNHYAQDVEAPVPVTAARPNFIDVQYANLYGNQYPLNTASQEIFMDNMFDSLNWSTGWNDMDYPFETPSLGWDQNAMTGWGPQANPEFAGYFNSVFTADEQAQLSAEMPYTVMNGHHVPIGHYTYQ